ncbi:NAD-dependent succinate-semialdehyde dehydrogenase [Microvirga subterranea]|uniref:Succinate-semialdehyde dehydrogenase/glutarate-semialdehyde dehydrogenase n=1 Tax=Microvirga subterranea TaxID=186651 RepID=A0A370HNN1_9HYPH|nr:NAD-dependent succinate-semialdehyde dehydrogenase [Microvirga subterranea]RDI59581.1 succinate-semialdehyde dehydrogenase/glutarate-semialdehyde dehydrogenase [Microvirga subterranea]
MNEAASRRTRTIDSVNPASGEILARFDEHQPHEIEQALENAARAQRQWARVPIAERVTLLSRAAKVLRERKSHYAALITLEMGKPIAEAEAEVEKCAWNCDFYAEKAEGFLATEPVSSNASDSMVVFDPLGVVLAIMPWNFPFWQFFRFAAPALAAGNGAILKHASNVPQCALAIEEVMREAGAPSGLFRTLLIGASAVEGLIDDPRIAAVTLTGSTEVGSLVASQAGRQIKKQVLELGGSDPFIVLADADVEEAAAVAARARFQNVGQSCIAAKRFIVEESVADAFLAALCARVKDFVVGDPMSRDCNIGPMARANLRDDLHSQIERSVAAGAELRLGGHPMDRPGFFYAPTVLDRVTPNMPAFAEETFGPAAAVIRVRDAEQAVALANATEYGLGAALWTRDLDKARVLARRIEAGAVFINGMVASDPRLPFGGIKKSGYGRELGVFGIREFTNIKTIWIGPARDATRVNLSE